MRAREACAEAGVPYLIGVETRPRSDPRHPRASFADSGSGAVALLRESDRVRDALARDPLFRGVAVHDWSAWQRLEPST